VTLFVPGTPNSANAWSSALSRHGLHFDRGVLQGDGLDAAAQVDWIDNDGEFGNAFSFGTVPPQVIEALHNAPGALVLHWPVDLRERRREILGVVERLREVGALAVQVEQSKVGWEVSRWLELFSDDDPWSWHRGAVAFMRHDNVLQSCGMHAFSLPDARATVDDEVQTLQTFASLLNVYQLGEDPLLLSGQTFSPDRETPRRAVERWPHTGYPPEHACHNPYGGWRLGPPGGDARASDQ